jgi:hypothetical protein
MTDSPSYHIAVCADAISDSLVRAGQCVDVSSTHCVCILQGSRQGSCAVLHSCVFEAFLACVYCALPQVSASLVNASADASKSCAAVGCGVQLLLLVRGVWVTQLPFVQMQMDLVRLRRVLRKTTARLEESEACIAELSRMRHSFDCERKALQARETALEAQIAGLQSELAQRLAGSEAVQAAPVPKGMPAAIQQQKGLEGLPSLNGGAQPGATSPDVTIWNSGGQGGGRAGDPHEASSHSPLHERVASTQANGDNGGSTGSGGWHTLNAAMGGHRHDPLPRINSAESIKPGEMLLGSTCASAAKGQHSLDVSRGAAQRVRSAAHSRDSSPTHQGMLVTPQAQERSYFAPFPVPLHPGLHPVSAPPLGAAGHPRLSPLLPDAKSSRVSSAALARYGILPIGQGTHLSPSKPPTCSTTPPNGTHPPLTARPGPHPSGPSPRLQTPRLQTPRSPDLSPAIASRAVQPLHSASLHQHSPQFVHSASLGPFPASSTVGSSHHDESSPVHLPCPSIATGPRLSSGTSCSSRGAPSVDGHTTHLHTTHHVPVHGMAVQAPGCSLHSQGAAARSKGHHTQHTCMQVPGRIGPVPLHASTSDRSPSRVDHKTPDMPELSVSLQSHSQRLPGGGAHMEGEPSSSLAEGSWLAGSHPHYAVPEAVAVNTTARYLTPRGVVLNPTHEAAAISQRSKPSLVVP